MIAVTGAIGSGKSLVCRMFRELGAAVVDADEIARSVVAPGSEGLTQIIKAFGSSVVAPDGSLDRRAVGRIVFSDRSKRELLEAITHPLIRKRADDELERQRAANPPLIIYDVPLLFETGLDQLSFKKIIVVSATEDNCIARAAARSSLSVEDIKKRLQAQIPLIEKERRADHVIFNNGTEDELRAKVRECFEELTR